MRHISLLTCALLISACSTTVITEDDKALPEETDVPAMEEGAMSYSANLDESYIAFTGARGTEQVHEGKFNDYLFAIEVMDGAPASLSLDITIDSLETQIEGLTNHLKADDFFDAATYPTATFRSSSIVEAGEDTYSITGDLTIRDITEAITLDATITDTYLTATYNLDRNVFGVGDPEKLDANVPMDIKIVFAQ